MTWAPTDGDEQIRLGLDRLESLHRRARRIRPEATWETYLRRSWTLRVEREPRSDRAVVRQGEDSGHAVRVVASGRAGFAASAGGPEGLEATAAEALASLTVRADAAGALWDGTGEILDLGASAPPDEAWIRAELDGCVRDRRHAGDACREAWLEIAVRHEFWVSDPGARRARSRTFWSLVLGGPREAAGGAAGPTRIAGRLPEEIRPAARPFLRWAERIAEPPPPDTLAGLPWVLAPEVAAWVLRRALNRRLWDPGKPEPGISVHVAEKPRSERFVRGGLFDDAGFRTGRRVRASFRDEPEPEIWGLEVAAGRRPLPEPCVWVSRAQQIGLPGSAGVLELSPAILHGGVARRLDPVRLAAGPEQVAQWLKEPVGEARQTGEDVLTPPLLMLPRGRWAETLRG